MKGILHKILILSLLFLLIQNMSILSQKCIIGAIYDKNDSIPLSFVNIYIKNKPIGTITNDLGQFNFHFADSLINDTLCISSIGYKILKYRLSDMLIRDHINIYLDTCNYSINGIYVMPKGQDAYTIVKNAIKKIRKNYPQKIYYLEAFYREISMRDDKYSRLLEASIDIQDYGYDTPISFQKVQINEVRKSIDYLKYDLKSKVYKFIYGDKNLLISTLREDLVRSLNSNNYLNFLSNLNFNRYSFKLSNCKYLDNKLVYVIEFRDTTYDNEYPIIKIENSGICGTIFILAEDFAILRIVYGLKGTKSNAKSNLLINNYWMNTIINYKKYNNKYYLDNIQKTTFVPYAMLTFSNDTSPGKQYYISTVFITNIFDKRKEFSKIKDKDSEPMNEDLFTKKMQYHPDFWKNYNIVLLNPILKSVRNDLENELSLEKQFILQGK